MDTGRTHHDWLFCARIGEGLETVRDLTLGLAIRELKQ